MGRGVGTQQAQQRIKSFPARGIGNQRQSYRRTRESAATWGFLPWSLACFCLHPGPSVFPSPDDLVLLPSEGATLLFKHHHGSRGPDTLQGPRCPPSQIQASEGTPDSGEAAARPVPSTPSGLCQSGCLLSSQFPSSLHRHYYGLLTPSGF